MQAGQKPISLTPGAAAAAVCVQCLGHGPALTARCPQAESGIARNPAHHTSYSTVCWHTVREGCL